MPVALHPLAGNALPSHAVVAVVHESMVGAHVGLLYESDDVGSRRLLHHAWHLDTRAEDPATYVAGAGCAVYWVPPGLNEDEIENLQASAELVATRLQNGGIPYAIAKENASFASNGEVRLGDSLGLTCATFLVTLFEAAQVPLLALASWDSGRTPQRRAEDTQAQACIVNHLMRTDPTHACRVGQDVGCTRVRAEEVAAAFGMTERPADFARVEPEGRSICARL